MAINKNFVVKNGLEVGTDLIVADAITNKVGIGSTGPRTELDVRGGIAATDLNITGVATIATLRATTGIVTNFDGINLNVSGVGTIATFESTTSTIENLNATNLDVSGIGTIGVGIVTNLSGTNLNYSGIGTVETLVATSVQTSNLNATGVTTIASLSVTGSTFETLTVNQYTNLLGVTTIANATGTNLNFSGVGTFASIDINGGDLEVANLDATDINVTGVSTLANATGTNLNFSGVGTIGTLQINSGVVTATSGIITYYGDGAYLQNISAGIGIGTTGGLVGYGVTFINFYGAGVSTALYDGNSGIATVYFEGGGASVSISTEAPTNPTSGDLWYNNNQGRIFIYYDEVAEGIGSAQVWVDAAPFNIGVFTSLPFAAGTVGAPSITFVDDSDTGFYSPASNQVGATVAGTQVARFNPGGVTVTGVVTATAARIGAATTFTEDLVVQGDARVTGILTIGTASLTIDSIGNINSTGIITASSFVGDGSGLTGTESTVGVDTTTNGTFYPLFTQNTSGYVTSANVADSKLTFNPSLGTLTATVLNSSSDENLKKDIKTIDNALDKVNQLRGVEFAWKENNEKSIGMIAQELQKVFPELVSEDSNGLSINYSGLIGVLIEAIKELSNDR